VTRIRKALPKGVEAGLAREHSISCPLLVDTET
jgi:hypothetical protein